MPPSTPSPPSAPDAHAPVLAREVSRALAPALGHADGGSRGVLVDATCGLGGHVRAVLGHARPRLVVGFDRDPDALALARAALADAPCPIELVDAPFSELVPRLAALDVVEVDAVLADLGVSSLQLDRGARGFSWRADAALDMRMDPRRGAAAADVLAGIDAAELTKILRDYGEEPDASRIARAIVAARPRTTVELAEVVTQAMSAPQRRKLGLRIHPATRTFQALRIHVNDELGELDRLLADAPELLAVGGRLAVISFHSLEDRRVKRRVQELTRPPRVPAHVPLREHELPRPRFAVPEGFARGVTAQPDEIAANPRSRSARLRVVERIAA
ncbi:MAG TPA: 16S rRNA (cytosine(1402)-N(4))-methyltransferase RsmH [Nannocystaceae bacterium]|nr:16S rRNA (cytosine(1402)-N(4))-methyltransferase RsmH [Nannocystaceae bacterium]